MHDHDVVVGAIEKTAMIETHRFRIVGVRVDGLPRLDGLVLIGDVRMLGLPANAHTYVSRRRSSRTALQVSPFFPYLVP
jgi:hypothetical protein